MYIHIDQLRHQSDFEYTELSNNENDTVNPRILVDKDIQLPQTVTQQLKSRSTPKSSIVTIFPTPSIANETSTTEKPSVKPDIPLVIHNRPPKNYISSCLPQGL